jgi:hypothetical protein
MFKQSNSMKVVPPDVPERRQPGPAGGAGGQSMDEAEGAEEIFDAECLSLINEYFYGLRIFPGQDPTHVFVGWVTTQYHTHSSSFSNDQVRTVSIACIDEFDGEVERYAFGMVFLC